MTRFHVLYGFIPAMLCMFTGTVRADVLLADPEPVLMAGAYYDGVPADNPENRIDPNTVDSPFAGIVSLGVNGTFASSAVIIGPRHALTAAHVLDDDHDTAFYEEEDHDGLLSVTPEELELHINSGGDSTYVLGITSIVFHPDFTGFDNPDLNDDLAVLTLATEIPAGVPIYPIYERPLQQSDVLTLVGYGRSGWGDLGFRPPFENFNQKRTGANVADAFFPDDEERNYPEVYTFDFDGTDESTNIIGGLTLGNEIETTLGYGDSGGAAFVFDEGMYKLAGINTFIARFTGQPASPPFFGSAGGGIMVFPLAGWIASETDVSWSINTLKLQVQGNPVCIQPGQVVMIDMDALNLAQRVTGVQAFLNFSSAHFGTQTGDVSVVAGGGVWDQLIYSVFDVQGDLDMAVGVNPETSTGTDADATIAIITLTVIDEGTTQLVFRPDLQPDPGLVETTLFSDENNMTVLPIKVDSQMITIDGTDPVIENLAASQGGGDVLDCAATTLQGTVNIRVDALDALAGLESEPAVTVTQGAESLTVTYVDENPAGTFNYTVSVDSTTSNGTWDITATATDKAGNDAAVTGTLCVNKNQITGTVEMATLASGTYAFDRDVVFNATDAGGVILKTWTISVHLANDSDPDGNPTTSDQRAAGSYELIEVPDGVAGLSAKTAWSLREKKAASLDSDGQLVVDFTGADQLRGGDLNGSNSINILDYSLLKTNWGGGAVADINGDGAVNTLDYSIMKSNWFRNGEAE